MKRYDKDRLLIGQQQLPCVCVKTVCNWQKIMIASYLVYLCIWDGVFGIWEGLLGIWYATANMREDDAY